MPCGFKSDNAETAKRKFTDSRSFIALASGCEILFGNDKMLRRQEIYNRAHGRCEVQSSPRCRGFANWNGSLMDGWHHTKIHDGKKCDCLSAGRWCCDPCHRHEHRARNPRWARQWGDPEAVKAFDELYPKG